MKEKIHRSFVREEAYFKLRDWIVEGALKPGQKLRDKELAEQLGVSRTPIREALLRLEEEGLVQTKANRFTLVSPIDFENASYLYAIVSTLEQLALRGSFPFLNEKAIEHMEKSNQRLLLALKKTNRLAALDADNEFHSVFIQLSKNKELEKILLGLKQKLKRLDLYYFEKVQAAYLSHEEHEQIIEALKKKNLSLALRAIEKNWKESFSRLQNSTEDTYVSK